MSTMTPIQTPTTPADVKSSILAPSIQGDQRMVFRGVDWHTYHSLSEATGDGQHVRLAYDGKDLEIIMVTSNIHEHLKELISKFVDAVNSGLEIDYVSCGETTWQSEVRGLQADLSYYFDPAKIQAASDALARESMNPADYPRPDLAIELDTSSPQIDRPSIYADLGVVEVWRYVNGQKFIIENLQADGSYAPVESSRFLHIRAVDIFGWLTAEDSIRESAWNRRLNQWAMGLGRQV
jgi:Putative restriction endonuclease